MPKRSYTITFKAKAVSLADEKGNRPAAEQVGIDENRIREWRLQILEGKFDDLIVEHGEGTASKRQRLSGGGCKPAYTDIENELVAWVLHQRLQFLRVTRKAISLKAA